MSGKETGIETGRKTDKKIGWTEKSRDDPEVVALRNHLQASNGIRNLEMVDIGDTARVIELFRRDGFVVIGDVLNADQIAMLAEGCQTVIDEVLALDTEQAGNRGSQRYSFGGSSLTRSQLHRPAWQMLLAIDEILDLVETLFGSEDFILRAASGDFCLPGTTGYQRLHADVRDWESATSSPFSAYHDPSGRISIRDLPCPYICVNFLPQDVTPPERSDAADSGHAEFQGKDPRAQRRARMDEAQHRLPGPRRQRHDPRRTGLAWRHSEPVR